MNREELKAAERSIELHKDEWLTIFGAKEEGCD